VPAIEADRDQLWAEGLARFLEAGVGWSGAYELAKAEHGAFKAHDVWQDAIRSWMYDTDFEGQARDLSCVRVCDVLSGALNLAVGQTTKAHEMRCGKALAAVGFTRSTKRVDGKVQKVWEVSLC
jgi:predicted P-loop ATPase